MLKFDNFRIIKYNLGNLLRIMSSPWLQKSFQMENISNIFASSFGDDGWHPIRKTLSEIDINPKINPNETSLWKYHKIFAPKSISMFFPDNLNLNLPTFIYPWGSFNDGLVTSDKNQNLSRFCGPSSDEFIYEEIKRIISLYKSLKQDGYLPTKYPNSFIGGTILEKINGETRFIVMQGNHRTAILAHLGYKTLNVRLIPQSLKYVKERDVKSWIMVKKGLCTEFEALQIFNLFFKEDGNHIHDFIRSNITK